MGIFEDMDGPENEETAFGKAVWSPRSKVESGRKGWNVKVRKVAVGWRHSYLQPSSGISVRVRALL